MTTGVIALAVPGSTAFAGEFLVLAGVFQQYWVYGVVGAVAIVLAAMYMLRLISGVLHRDVGSAVSDAARDLVPGELAVLVPLVACLLALSVWPAAISEHSFPQAKTAIQTLAAPISGATVSAPRKFRPPRTPAVPHGSMCSEGGICP
jgi:NADH-quinone oxidoreductase subunit M